MYKPSLVENLGRYIPDPPRHAPSVLPDLSLIAIIETKKKIFAIDVTHFFDYEMHYKDFMDGVYISFELYAVSTIILSKCKSTDQEGE